LISRLKSATDIPVSLHICGNSTPILPHMASSGADVLELDHAVDLTNACRIAGPDIAIWGNLDPISVLSRGTPDDVRRHAAAVIAAANGHHRFVLSSGCTLAVETPAANIRSLIEAQSHSSVSGPPRHDGG
jgi:uroporphyrinogen-III decarboxylase